MIKTPLRIAILLLAGTLAAAQTPDTVTDHVQAGLAAQMTAAMQQYYILQNLDARVAADLLRLIPK